MVRFLTDNPSLSVEIRSYTDSKGLESYNDELSVKRAQAVMSYMGSKGIDRGRMIARGEGMKTQLNQTKSMVKIILQVVNTIDVLSLELLVNYQT